MDGAETEVDNELLALVARYTSHAVMILSPEDRILWVNAGYTALTGWDLDTIRGKAPWEFMNGADTAPETIERLAEAAREGKAAFETILNYRKDGTPLWVRINKEPVYREDGVLRYFISIERDVSRQVEQGEALAHSEQTLRDAIEALSDGFVLYDQDDRLVICNERYKEFYETSRDLLVEGASFSNIIRAGAQRGQYKSAEAYKDLDGWIQDRLDRHVNATGDLVEQQLDDGRWLHIREQKTRNGGTVGIRTDVTALKKAQLEAEQANRTKSEFLATMSHELRTPLAGMTGIIDLLETTGLTAQQQDYIDNLRSSSQGLLALLNDILDLSKIEAGRLELESRPFDPDGVAREILQLFRANANAKGLALNMNVSEGVPASLMGDEHRFRQILVNLVGNAIKFTDSGSVAVDLRIQSPGTACRLTLEVRDTGIGIERGQLDHIFDPFVQADATISRRFSGTGLGLAICQRLADAMAGTIDIDSTPGEGTKVTVTLPCRPARPGVTPEDRPGDKAPAQLPKLRILLAEDVPLNLMIMETMLNNEGHTVSSVDNGQKALDHLRNGQAVDLVLMDMRMPVMDGAAATRAIRQLEPPLNALPVIALTADAMDAQREEFFAAGVDAVLTKPVNWSELSKTISNLI